MDTAVTTPPTSVVRTARAAVFTAFAINGAAFAAFASRVPDLKHELSLSAGELGLTLLAASLGSVIGLPISGFIVHRLGAARDPHGRRGRPERRARRRRSRGLASRTSRPLVDGRASSSSGSAPASSTSA